MVERVQRKRESSYTVGGNVNWYSHYGEQYEGYLKKTKNIATIWSSENHNLKRYTHYNVQGSTIYKSQYM